METARAAEPGDVPVIVDLLRLLAEELQPMRGGRVWHARERRPDPLTAAVTQLVAEPETATVAVGLIDTAIVGVGIVEYETMHSGEVLAVIRELFVDPEARTVGVGERIADFLVVAAAARNCIGIDALALPGHRATKNFFEDQGFVARALTMHRPLQS